MKAQIKALLAYLAGPAFNFLLHWAATAVVAVGLHFGAHISVPVIPATLGLFGFTSFLKMILVNLGNAWHSGRLIAEARADAGQLGGEIVSQIVAAASGK